MYERFFQLRERPFALSPDPDYLYPSRVHREALGYLRYGIESQAGFVVITGEIGSGKTTLLQALLRGLDGQTTVVRLMNTLLEPRELLEAIAIDLGIEPGTASKPVLLRDLANRLVEERGGGRLVLLVIDEAQNLGLPALEEIRMLSNLETEKSKLLQVVLIGQPDLRDKLSLPALEQLRQRITVSYHLTALDASETEAYINHRLRRASLGAPLQFRRDVTDRVHERARGVPRLVNVICDAALIFAYAEERRLIDQPLLEEALVELEATGVLRPSGAVAESPAGSEPEPAIAKLDAPEHRPVGLEDRALAATASAAPPVDPVLAREVVEKEAALRVKEQQLERREEQLAEQRRVLAEEYRLFRVRQSRELTLAAVETLSDSASPGWPPAPAYQARSTEAPRRAFHPGASDSARVTPFAPDWADPPPPRRRFWRRVKHVLLGVPEPVMEDRP
jgi:putative secretion ATPase (PEP-CTERM system associated)